MTLLKVLFQTFLFVALLLGGLWLVVTMVESYRQNHQPVEVAQVVKTSPPATQAQPATQPASVPPSQAQPVVDTKPKLAKCGGVPNPSSKRDNPQEVHLYGPKRTEHAVFTKGVHQLTLVHEPGAGRAMLVSSLGSFTLGQFHSKTGGCRDFVLGDMWCVLMDWRNPQELPMVDGKAVVTLTAECPNQSFYFGMQYSAE